ncbi:MAG: protease SohB [Myxococcales bacterium]|nr:protease SohB [Myxococcales bacterium]
MEYLADYGLFLAKSITIVVAILVAIAGIVGIVVRQRKPAKGKLEIVHLNKRYEDMEKTLSTVLASDADLRLLDKAARKQHKSENKSSKKKAKNGGGAIASANERTRLFVLDFDGDLRASAVASLREEISAVLTVATSNDEVLVTLESGGGLVHSYGLAASQLQRIRNAGVPLTIAVDKVAASGGYMMACVANKLIAAPFAYVGSIGVVMQMPNVNRVLKKHDVDYEMLYAGQYKRTLTVFGENDDEGRAKMQADLEDTHALFKDFIIALRPELDIERVATGETWPGTRALELGLVDELRTSDDYLMSRCSDADLLKISYKERKGMVTSLSSLMSIGLGHREKLQRDQSAPRLV